MSTLHSRELLGTGKIRSSDKAARHRNGGLKIRFIDCLGQAKVDYFSGHSASLFKVHHDVTWFNVPVNQLLLVHRSQAGSDLRRDFEC